MATCGNCYYACEYIAFMHDSPSNCSCLSCSDVVSAYKNLGLSMSEFFTDGQKVCEGKYGEGSCTEQGV